jgi:aerobic-type carbon monoxide dehydrogenase small subunit (CoxS/CutS family)
MKQELKFTVNGQPYDIFVKPNMLLVDVLRRELKLTGTKRGCESASCGACTVNIDGMAVKSCSILAMQANGHTITTSEGLAKNDKLSPIQKAFLDHGAYQCGFCTSGILMALNGLFNETKKPTQLQIKEAIDQNICRCTGYNSIVRAAMDVAKGEYKE